MTWHTVLPTIGWCAVGLLLAGCETTSRWIDDRVDARPTHREVLVADTGSLAAPRSLRASNPPVVEVEITPVASEQSAQTQEVATLIPVEDAVAVEAVDTPIEPVVSPSFTLATLEQMALENNPAIRQATASVSKATGFRDQVGLYPNPTLAYSGQQLGDAGTDQHMLTLSQDIVTGNKLGLSQQVLSQAVQAQLWEVEAQRQRVLTDVRTMYYEALAAQRRMALATEFQVLAAKGVRVAESRKAALEGSQPEILQAEIQLQEVELQQQQAQYELTAAWQELTALIGLPDLSLPHWRGSCRRLRRPAIGTPSMKNWPPGVPNSTPRVLESIEPRRTCVGRMRR